MPLLLAAANQDEGNAMFIMGRYMIDQNEGWPHDPKRAARYLKKLLDHAGEAGLGRDRIAEIAKAYAYCHCPGAARCGENAKTYFEYMSLAAKNGSKIAAHELAFCFSNGIGTERNDGLALREWIALDKAPGTRLQRITLDFLLTTAEGLQKTPPWVGLTTRARLLMVMQTRLRSFWTTTMTT